MADYRGIAAITATLRNTLAAALLRHSGEGPLASARVETRRPEKKEPADASRGIINIFLYQVTPNPSLRNVNVPWRDGSGQFIRRPMLALDLHYLFTFYGDDDSLVPQLLLGITENTLSAFPYLDESNVPTWPAGAGEPSNAREVVEKLIAEAGIQNEVHLVRTSPLSMSHEELSKLWTIFFQVPYHLSAAFLCSVVYLEPDVEVRAPALPVREPSVRFNPSFQLPQIDRVIPQTLDYHPRALLTLEGSNLASQGLSITIGGEDAPIEASTGSVLRVRLPDEVTAGIQTIRIARSVDLGDPPRPHRIFEGDPASVSIRPVFRSPPEYLPSEKGPQPQDPADSPVQIPARIRVELAPAVGPGQPVELLLNELRPPDDRAPETYRLSGSAASRDEGNRSVLEIPARGVAAGSYLVRVSVSGVYSRLLFETDPASPDHGLYIAPTVLVPPSQDSGAGT